MYKKYMKRVVDILCALAAIIVFSWLYILVAILVRVKLGSPVLFKQKRPGLNGKIFTLYKFRTMTDARDEDGNLLPDDVRLTKFGRLLRKTSLDELPEAFNILKGDMSVVGPRPERPVFVEQFEQEIENYDYRFAVKAGLTSLSHVYGRYSTYIHDRTYYDLFYITHYSLFLDIKIMLLTAKTMFLKSAAEGVEENFANTASEEAQTEVESK